MSEHFIWTAYSERVAAQWRVSIQPLAGGASARGIDGPTGVVVYGGPVTSDDLRAVSLSRLTPAPPAHPTWEQEKPPAAADLAARWRRSAGARARLGDPSTGNGPARQLAVLGMALTPRMAGETTDSFYERVAAFYVAAARESGRPTLAIAQSADVPRSTAARWVREARARGFLAPTTRGRGRA